jgi:hypothetical protein
VAGVYLTLQVVVLSNDILKYVDTKNPTLSLIVMIVWFLTLMYLRSIIIRNSDLLSFKIYQE